MNNIINSSFNKLFQKEGYYLANSSKVQNSVLFDIDSIIDKEIGAIHLLQTNRNILSDNMKKKINFDILESLTDDSLNSIQINEYSEMGFSALEKLFDDPTNAPILYERLNNEYKKDIILNSIVTSSYTLIKTYMGIAKSSNILSAIRYSNIYEEEFIDKVFPGISKINHDFSNESLDPLNLEQYGRLIISDIKMLDLYKPEGKNILVLNYRKNFEKDHPSRLLSDYILEYGDINEFEIASAYTDVGAPNG